MMVRQGTAWAVKRMGTRVSDVVCAGLGPGGPQAFGEGLGEEWFVGPSGDEVYGEAVADGFHEGAAIEAGGGAGVLRSEAEDAGVLDAVGSHLRDDVGDVGMPVAHAHVDVLAE